MKYQTISLKHTFAGEDKTYYVEIAMVIFFLYKNNMLFLCVNKSHEAYLGFHRCLQNIIIIFLTRPHKKSRTGRFSGWARDY